jgi:uncharacterized repeat protein (TIGR02543 family)
VAITVNQVRYNRNGSGYQGWTTPNNGNYLKAGYDGSDYWTTQIKFTVTEPFQSLSLNIAANNNIYCSSSHPLHWGIATSETAQMANRYGSVSGTTLGSIYFPNGTWVVTTFTKSGIGYANGTYYLTIWQGTSNYGDYTELVSYSGTPISMSYTATPTRTITYNANGGSGSMANTTYKYLQTAAVNLRKNAFTRPGYQFLGWSLSSTATSASYTDGQQWSSSSNSNYTLYAVWKANSLIHVATGSGFADFQIYIANGSGWDMYLAYVANGKSFDQYV